MTRANLKHIVKHAVMVLPVAFLLASLCAAAHPVAAQRAPSSPATADAELATDIHETVARAPVTVKLLDGSRRTGDMIITHYRPPSGNGPYPLVVMSHGRSTDKRDEPSRFRSVRIARYWVRRGFAVIVPTRLGYGATGIEPDTELSGRSCEDRTYVPMSEAAAHQIATAIAFGKTLPWIDKSKIILMGQSVGGLATTVANAKGHAGVIAAVNSAGGSGGNPAKNPGKPCAPERLATVYEAAGKTAKTPMLWLYSQNDKYWGTSLPRQWHKSYTAAGAKAEFVMLPANGDDGHKQLEFLSLWRPHVDRFIATLGFSAPKKPEAPPPSNFAKLDDASKIPFVKDEVRSDGYQKFLALDVPRACVVSPTGNWAFYGGRTDALQAALTRCAASAKQPCKPYAVDDAVVWKP
jgi:dienelactone hydrolase